MPARQSLQPSRRPEDYTFAHRLRARFSETDAMGVVHHASYLLYLEEARVEFLRHLGHPYGEVRRDGSDLAVLEVSVQYRGSAHFDDELTVHLWAGAVTRTTFQIAYLVTIDGEARATAVTVHGCIDERGRGTRLPAWIGETFSG
jgi:acyl-CoA thioester hydrolase